METQDQNIKKDAKEQIESLEQEMKSAFKEANYDAVKTSAEKLKALDSNNALAEKLTKKIEKLKQKEEKIAKKEKEKEYRAMLKKLFKEGDVEKLSALAKEFKDTNPESRHANKWLIRADRLKEKLAGKKEENKEAPEEAEEVKEEEKVMPLIAKKPEVTMPPPAPSTPSPAPSTPTTMTAPTAEEKQTLAAPAPKEAPKEPAKEAKGNIFTKMFGKKEEAAEKKSIIDTIVAKTDKKEAEKTSKEETKEAKPKKEWAGLLTFSRVFMNFTIIFIIFSAAFLYVEWIDKENTMLELVGISENTGAKLHNASEEVNALKRKELVLQRDIELFKGGYDDKALSTVETIIDERINWPDIFAKINEVTNSVYELNDFFKYVEYNNYSFDAEQGSIRVTGTLSDPLGRNLTKLVELEEAFKFYPKDKNNPEDTTQPYFTNFREFTSFSKSLDPQTNRFTSNFQMSFSLNE